jgi:hypothetical protein
MPMDRAESCPLCCETCIGNGVDNEHGHSVQDPFALDNLLSAGTITVDVHDGHLPCVHRHASDSWHPVSSRQLSAYAEDDVFCIISFLTEHQFLRATCRLGTSRRALYIRIYLVPNDLPNVQGRLRHRSKAIFKDGSRYLQSLLPMIVQDPYSWSAESVDANELPSINRPRKYLVPRAIVSTP